MATTRHILRVLCLSVLLNLIHFSMGLENDSLHQSRQQVLCPVDVGVFNPDVPDVDEISPVVVVDSDTIYRDIYTWVELLDELANVSSTENDITQVIQPCLRGSAAIWWLVELTSMEREALRKASLPQWSSVLVKRFGLPRKIARKLFRSLRYTPQDLAQPPRVWIHQMIQYSKAAGIDPDMLILDIWLQFDPSFDIPFPMMDTLVQFLERIDDAYPFWIAKSRGYSGGFRTSDFTVPSSNYGFIDSAANALRAIRLI